MCASHGPAQAVSRYQCSMCDGHGVCDSDGMRASARNRLRDRDSESSQPESPPGGRGQCSESVEKPLLIFSSRKAQMQDENFCAVEPRIALGSIRSRFNPDRRVALKDVSVSDLTKAIFCTKMVSAVQEMEGGSDRDVGEAHR
jgi:hypothetical protein